MFSIYWLLLLINDFQAKIEAYDGVQQLDLVYTVKLLLILPAFYYCLNFRNRSILPPYYKSFS